MKSTSLSKNRHCEGKCNLRTINRKLTLNFIVSFNSFTDTSVLKYVSKIFLYLLLFSGKTFGGVLRYSSQWLFLYILSSKGANQLQVLFIRTLGNKLLKLGF